MTVKNVNKYVATRVFVIYIIIFYFIPIIADQCFNFHSDLYQYPMIGYEEWALAGLLALVTWCGLTVSTTADGKGVKYINVRHIPDGIYFVIYAALLGIAAYGYSTGLSGWRYSSEPLSSGLSANTIFFIGMPPIVEFFAFREIFFSPLPAGKITYFRIRLLLLAITCFFLASGVGPMLLAGIVVIFGLFPRAFRVLLFDESVRRNPVSGSWGKATSFFVVGFILAASALILGEMIKNDTSISDVLAYYENLPLSEFFIYLLGRFSTAYVSLLNSLDSSQELLTTFTMERVLIPFKSFLFRIDTLMGGAFGVARPDPGSLMRFNYENISALPINAREGTSPGLFAAFSQALPAPVSIFGLFLYVIMVASVIKKVGKKLPNKLSWVGCIGLLYFFMAFFSSPLDLMLIVDQTTISVVLLSTHAMLGTGKKRG
jgi:hypothetical protein